MNQVVRWVAATLVAALFTVRLAQAAPESVAAAQGLLQRGEAEKAAEMLRHMVAENPSDAPALSLLCTALAAQGKFEAALGRYDDLVKLRGTQDPETLRSLSQAVLVAALAEETASEKMSGKSFREGLGKSILESLPPRAATGLLADLLHHPTPLVRRRAIDTLSEKNDAATLRGALADPDETVRLEAAAALGRTGDKSVVRILHEGSHHRDKAVRDAALAAMSTIPFKWIVPELRPFLEDPDIFTRILASEALGRLGAEEAYMMLRTAMRSHDRFVRSAAYSAVQNIGGERAAPLLKRALKDADPIIRLYAAVSLGTLENHLGLPVLVGFMKSDDKNVRLTAVTALARMQDPKAQNALLAGLNDLDGAVRAKSAEGLLRLHVAAPAIPVLQALLGTSGPDRMRALAALKAAAAPAALPLLVIALKAPERPVRLEALDMVAHLAVPSLDVLRQALSDPDVEVKVRAASHLSRLKDESGVKSLLGWIKSGDAASRDQMLGVLEQMGGDVSVALLREFAQSEDRTLRLRAIAALGGSGLPAAAEVLADLGDISDRDVRRAVVAALGAIPGDLSTYLLKKGLADAEPAIRIAASESLARRGLRQGQSVLQEAARAGDVPAALALCRLGDPEALATARKILADSDGGVRIRVAVDLLFDLVQ